MVDAEGRDCSKICPCCFGPETEPQSLVGVWRMKNEEDVLLRLRRRLEDAFFHLKNLTHKQKKHCPQEEIKDKENIDVKTQNTLANEVLEMH